ncbi:hypothetical protein [Desertimonas flava]|uniref:hypothetical protein n=1 Tax=Desertimonas flava TaxID=2064846 RepID=UPI000E341429|nr:hypothetical protein [Desertimonas flava]
MSGSSARRHVVVGVVVATFVGVALAGWAAGSRVQSPAAAAARARAPEPSLIAAPVELRILASRVVTRGDVVPGESVTITGPSSDDGATVTRVPVAVGDEVAEGAAVLEMSGRPVVVIEGTVPAYRTMRPGVKGADVDQLQTGLERLGCDTTGDLGVYGDATKACVAELYDRLGYEPVPSSDTEATDLADAREAMADAEETLGAAEVALDDAAKGPARADVVAAEIAVDAARRNVERSTTAAVVAQVAADAAVDNALMSANSVLADAESTAPERAAASAAVEAAALAADVAARDSVEAAEAAAEELRLAQATLADLIAPPDVTAEAEARARARDALDRATAAVTDLEARSGPTIPFGEVVFVPALPATVSSLRAEVGDDAAGGDDGGSGADGLIVLATSALQVEATVSPSDAAILRIGMTVEVMNDGMSTTAIAGRLSFVGEQVESSGDGRQRGLPVIVDGVDPIPPAWTGSNVRVTFTAAATSSPVLVVPLAAVWSGADGQARVEVVDDDAGTVTAVAVEPGLSADGFVQVTPVATGELGEGDQVVVGENS